MNRAKAMRNLHLVDSPSAPIRSPGADRTRFRSSMHSAPRSAAAVVSSCSKPRPGWARPCCSNTRASLADDAGWLVRRAAPGPLEHHLPFGVIRTLLETPVRESGMALDGAAAVAGALLVNARRATWRLVDDADRAQRAVGVSSCSAERGRWRWSSTTRSSPTRRRWRCCPISRGGSRTCRCCCWSRRARPRTS